MMLRVNNEYLDFNESITQDRKAKLFEEIDSVDGDVSFEFEIYLSSQNAKILDFPYPDSSSKRVYRAIDADAMDNSGQLVSRGFIKIERKIGDTLFCSFWGGNNNWFAALTGNMSDLRLSQYDQDQTEANIVSSWTATEGIVWPLIDTGTLSLRSYFNLKVEDFAPAFYVKTLFKEIFQQSGMKIDGELLQDWRYNNITVASNRKNGQEITNRSSYALKDITQTIAYPNNDKITFNDDSNYPYFDGSQNNFDLALSRYVADVRMNVRVEVSMIASSSVGGNLTVTVNGSEALFKFTQSANHTLQGNLILNQGDYVEVMFLPFFSSTQDILQATLRITPQFIYKAFGVSSVPNWTKQDFISEVIALFNVIPAFDPYTKTVTFNIFDKLKDKEPIDLSEFLENIETDYSEFISDYGKQNLFLYQETDIDNLQEYNISTFLSYGTGVIEANNDFVEESVEVLESEFASPISYINGSFDMSLERIPFVELEDDVSSTFDGVEDGGSGVAQINVDENIFEVNDLVRIEGVNPTYDGEWMVTTVGAGFILVRGAFYSVNTTGTVTKLVHQFTTEDNVYLFLNIPTYPVTDASGNTGIYLESTLRNNIAIAYFNLLNTAQPINDKYKQGLSFGTIQDPLFYQRTMLQDYWATFARMVNDPVKLKADAYLPWKVHNQIDFLRPIMIKTLESTNLYYCNREVGYENSYTPAEIELIKLP
jgi:hypothetical protein